MFFIGPWRGNYCFVLIQGGGSNVEAELGDQLWSDPRVQPLDAPCQAGRQGTIFKIWTHNLPVPDTLPLGHWASTMKLLFALKYDQN